MHLRCSRRMPWFRYTNKMAKRKVPASTSGRVYSLRERFYRELREYRASLEVQLDGLSIHTRLQSMFEDPLRFAMRGPALLVASARGAQVLTQYEASATRAAQRLSASVKASPDALVNQALGSTLAARLKALATELESLYPESKAACVYNANQELHQSWIEMQRKLKTVLTEIEERFVTQLGMGPDGSPRAPCTHAPDFTWMKVDERHYTFKKGNQAETVRVLFEESKKSGFKEGCGLSEKAIAHAIDASADSFAIRHTFRDHPAYKTLVRPCGKGKWAISFRDESARDSQ